MGRVASFLLVVVLAGCLQGSPPSAPATTSQDPREVVTDSLGAIEVLVTTPEVEPIAGAQVILGDTEFSGTSDEGGRVLFRNLEPSKYTVVAAKAGYRSLQPQGRVVDVVAGEVVQAKLILEPVPVVTAESSYHRSLIFKGFISCSAEWVRVAVLANRTQCGKGVNAGGTTVGDDPNENASHPWKVENVQIQTIIMEAEWRPTIEAIGANLYFATHSAYTCTATSCQYSNVVFSMGGRSPLRAVVNEGAAHNITEPFGGTDEIFPKDAWSVGLTQCPSGCAASVSFQQSYDLTTSAFYGLEAPPGWTSKGPA